MLWFEVPGLRIILTVKRELEMQALPEMLYPLMQVKQ
jgi:hypothetical protein